MEARRFEGESAVDAATVAANVARIRDAIASAARRSDRAPEAVTLVGVTKSVGAAEARWLLDAGVSDLGENRPEDLLAKSVLAPLSGARWHLIGTYQRRKVRDTLSAIAVVHSVHSVELAAAISARAAEIGRTVDCLIQVNVSGEPTKQGFAAAAAEPALAAMRRLPSIRWRGVMTMAPADAPADACRAVFARTRELRDRLRDPALPLPDLSMGMTSDFVPAILEGATIVRIGTALFRVGSPGPGS
jgi:pyridoxal phosphate enzyme (YggS family)